MIARRGKHSVIFPVLLGLLAGCTHQRPVSTPATPAPTEDIQTVTLQYRISRDAVAPSQFVAFDPTGMTMGLTIHWMMRDDKKQELDAMLTQLERGGVNGREFLAKAKWVREGIELEVYDIEAASPQGPPACADSVARALGPLVGHWRVRAVFRAGSTWDTSAGSTEIQPAHEGCLLREQLVTARGGAPFRTLSLWGAVGLQAPIQRTFVHTQHGLLSVFSGARTATGLVLRDSQVVGGTVVLLEHRFEPFLVDSMRFTSRRSADNGATWTVTWYADYVRRAPDSRDSTGMRRGGN